ncbi:serine/threonine-protein kinase [Nocardia sp. NPDC019395]|uniref:serine/threonine-protein kinase n=1 Tax=Nocardia sp. NPDC019395 TaxID=3154686 RepID=UPI0033E616E4
MIGHNLWYPLLVEGTPFGRYRLLELLGAGAMGEVHRAYDTGTDRLVAVKVLAPEFAHNEVYRKRFQREAQMVARLSEPHIVPIHDFGEIDGRLFLDMRLVQAPNLAKLLVERDHLEPGEAVEVITQIAAALDAAHAEGLVHRDVKPSNILLTPDGFAYLIDFGIARSDEDTTLTTTGAVVGTFAYMAPERLADDESDGRSDVYSLACVLYECLVGAKPYRGESMQRQVAAHLNAEPPRPSAEGLPSPFDAVIAKGMAKDPGRRYDTTGELAAAARSALLEPPTATASTPAPEAATPAAAIPTPDPAAVPTPTAPGPAPAPAPAKRLPWRAAVAVAVLAVAVAGTSALALTRDDAALVTEPTESPAPAISSTTVVPTKPARSSSSLPPPPAPAPPVSVTESVPVTSAVPGGAVPEPAGPPAEPAHEPQPSQSPPPPPPTTTTPPPVTTTTTEPPTESETTTPATSTSEPTVTTTTEENGGEGDDAAGGDSGADATGSTVASSSAVGTTGSTGAATPSGTGTTSGTPTTGTTSSIVESSTTTGRPNQPGPAR